jgi:hypothetical protein
MKYQEITIKDSLGLINVFMVDTRISKTILGEFKQLIRRGEIDKDSILAFEAKHLLTVHTEYEKVGIGTDEQTGESYPVLQTIHYITLD